MYQSLSKEQLKQRRRKLRQQRRVNALRSLWRLGCMCGILGGVVWATNQSYWTISTPSQVRIQGNRYLSEAAIRSMLAIRYPQSLLQLEPSRLSAKLLATGSISNVRIDRALLPPHVTVQLQDRPPVAQVIRDEVQPPQAFIDDLGVKTPIASYLVSIQQSAPKLRLIQPERGICGVSSLGWQYLHRAISRSPVVIGIIDCQDPKNLRLRTEVGHISLGSLGNLERAPERERLNHQLKQLDRLRDWQKNRRGQFNYLDLGDPDHPILQPNPSGPSAP